MSHVDRCVEQIGRDSQRVVPAQKWVHIFSVAALEVEVTIFN